jgi:hypothetical protein
MSARNTAQVRMCLTPAETANTIEPVTIVEIPAADGKPAGVKVTTAASTEVMVGEVIKFLNVGFANLNNKAFVVTAVGESEFSIGNVILGNGTVAIDAIIERYLDSEMNCICLSEFTISTAAPAVIDTSTYCGSGSIPSAKVEAGTAAAVGYVDVADPGYIAILDAVETGKEYILRVTLGENGYLVMPVVLSGLSWTLPLDGAQAYSFQFTFGAVPKHLFA